MQSNFSQIKNYRAETKLFKGRLLLSTFIIICLFGLLTFRLSILQISHHGFYTHLAQHNQTVLLPVEADRGLIYDRNGILIATNIPVFNLSIIPDKVPSLKATISQLQKLIVITPENIKQFKRFLKQHKRFDHIPIKFKLTQDELDNFYANQYRFPGVVVDSSMIRNYPLSGTMVNALGYVGRINAKDLQKIDAANYGASNFMGKTGIEKFYEAKLHGKEGDQQVAIDAAGHIVRTISTTSPINGENLYLTIDSKLQKAAIDALGTEHGAVVAIDPKTGEVLALAANPTYDPNLFAKGIDFKSFQELQNSPGKPMYNRTVSAQYPLASTIKPYIALEGLNSGTVDQNYSIHDPGWFKLPNSSHVYWDWVHKGHGTVNVSKAIMVSCDTYFYTLAVKLGIERIDNALIHFGFGKKTNIEIPEENQGIVSSPKWKREHTGKTWYPGDTVISGIGQGFMSATPIQLAAAVATIAERGKRFRPHLLLKAELPDGKIITTPSETLPPVVLKNKKYWDIVINAMHGVVSSWQGTARTKFGATPYTVAAKTGGAQLYHHVYSENSSVEDESKIPKHLRNHTLFIAFAPVDNPKIAIAVVAENSIMAPMVARKVMDFYLLPHEPDPAKQDNDASQSENQDSPYEQTEKPKKATAAAEASQSFTDSDEPAKKTNDNNDNADNSDHKKGNSVADNDEKVSDDNGEADQVESDADTSNEKPNPVKPNDNAKINNQTKAKNNKNIKKDADIDDDDKVESDADDGE